MRHFSTTDTVNANPSLSRRNRRQRLPSPGAPRQPARSCQCVTVSWLSLIITPRWAFRPAPGQAPPKAWTEVQVRAAPPRTPTRRVLPAGPRYPSPLHTSSPKGPRRGTRRRHSPAPRDGSGRGGGSLLSSRVGRAPRGDWPWASRHRPQPVPSSPFVVETSQQPVYLFSTGISIQMDWHSRIRDIETRDEREILILGHISKTIQDS